MLTAGQTSLYRAIHHGYFDIALLLVSYGASFEVNDFRHKSPVQYCCKPKNYLHEQSQIKEQLVFNYCRIYFAPVFLTIWNKISTFFYLSSQRPIERDFSVGQ